MLNFDYIAKKDMKGHNLNWPQIPDRPYKSCSGSGRKIH